MEDDINIQTESVQKSICQRRLFMDTETEESALKQERGLPAMKTKHLVERERCRRKI